MINLENIYYDYSNINALSNINLKIDCGEAVAIIGPNGSGKSTILKLINGLIFPSKGKYVFDGIDINQKKMEDSSFARSFHKKLGFIFQNSDSQLFCSNVYDEVAFGPLQMGFTKNEVEKRVEECLKFLDIYDLRERVPYNLSGGEKRKVAIASVLSYNPNVLIIDEPMNGLDPKTKRFIRELLIKLHSVGKTIIVSTHDFKYVEDVFTRAVVFSKEHKIIRDDEYKKVMDDENFLFENNII